MKTVAGVLVGILFLMVLFLPTTDAVTGFVKDAGERQAYMSTSRVGGSSRFIGVTIVAGDGTNHHGAIPIDGGALEDVVHDLLPGDVVTVKLGRTAYWTTIGSHAVREKDGTIRLVESTEVGWRLVKQYKIEKRPVPEAK